MNAQMVVGIGLVVGGYGGAVAAVWSWCRAAANGDRVMSEARER